MHAFRASYVLDGWQGLALRIRRRHFFDLYHTHVQRSEHCYLLNSVNYIPIASVLNSGFRVILTIIDLVNVPVVIALSSAVQVKSQSLSKKSSFNHVAASLAQSAQSFLFVL
jgi:hypothetical protein